MATKEDLAIPVGKNVFTLPLAHLLPLWLNIGCGKDYREGWLNVDLSLGIRADEHFDAFTFPWDLPSSHFETVVVNHLVEHIPHQVPDYSGDGFYVFFEEVYRVLRPGGKVSVAVPYWKHANAVVDPTHTRVVHPKAFDFFNPDHPQHHQTHAKFLVSSRKTRRGDRICRYFKSHFDLAVPGVRKVDLEVTLVKV